MTPIPQLEQFEPISLKGLETKADMLTRLDNKYIVRGILSEGAGDKLRDAFDVLTIDDKRSFGYHNVYFDQDGLCFDQHKQGKRHKFKARTRVYLDSENLAFFEVKLSGKGGQTDKFRMRVDEAEHGTMPEHFMDFLKETYLKQYGKAFAHDLAPSVTTAYRRITLVAKEGRERLTIDHDLALTVNGKQVAIPEGLAIFETKSINGNGLADKILRSERIRTVSGCSKFCLAMSLSGEVRSYNKFKPLIKKFFLTAPEAERGWNTERFTSAPETICEDIPNCLQPA